MAEKKKQLTLNQRRFVEEYIKDSDGTRSYMAVYKNANRSTARSNAAKLLVKAGVKAYLNKLQARHSKKVEIEAQDILKELKYVGMARIDNVLDFDDNGIRIKDSKGLSKSVLSSVQSVSITETKEGARREVKLYDKLSALKQLGDSLGLFKDFDTLVRGIEQYGEVTWNKDNTGFTFEYADQG